LIATENEMTGGRIRVRTAAGRDDLGSWADIKNQLTPLDRVTVDELAHDIASYPPALLLLATIEGAPVGSGIGRLSPSMPDTLFAMIRVLPANRGRGVGSALYAALSDHARGMGLSHLWGRIAESDSESLSWVTRRGFTEIARESEFVLTLADATGDVGPPLPDGLEIVSLATRPDLVVAAHRIESETISDIPGPFPQVPDTYEEWAAKSVDLPGFLADGSFVALLDREPVGYAGLNRKDASLAEHLLTGVVRSARRMGVATALKTAQIQWARRAGYEELVTWTSSRNDPMRAINLLLGYVEQPASLTVRGPLAKATG
jgi:GNAT superfamily N-acetyltransferase